MAKIIKNTELRISKTEFDSILDALYVLRLIRNDLSNADIDTDDVFELDLCDNEKMLVSDLKNWVSVNEDVELIVEGI